MKRQEVEAIINVFTATESLVTSVPTVKFENSNPITLVNPLIDRLTPKDRIRGSARWRGRGGSGRSRRNRRNCGCSREGGFTPKCDHTAGLSSFTFAFPKLFTR